MNIFPAEEPIEDPFYLNNPHLVGCYSGCIRSVCSNSELA